MAYIFGPGNPGRLGNRTKMRGTGSQGSKEVPAVAERAQACSRWRCASFRVALMATVRGLAAPRRPGPRQPSGRESSQAQARARGELRQYRWFHAADAWWQPACCPDCSSRSQRQAPSARAKRGLSPLAGQQAWKVEAPALRAAQDVQSMTTPRYWSRSLARRSKSPTRVSSALMRCVTNLAKLKRPRLTSSQPVAMFLSVLHG